MDELDINSIVMRLLMFYPIFLFSLTIHEIAHALTANWGGDLTATYENRLSLNPLVHMDPLGTFLIPVMSSFTGIPLFGWARPVPFVESNFHDKRWSLAVAMAGPFSNLLLALFGALIYSLGMRILIVSEDWGWVRIDRDTLVFVSEFFYMFVALNLSLMIFNLTPIPPLDGSHVFHYAVIRGRGHLYGYWEFLQNYGIFILLFGFWTLRLGQVYGTVIYALFNFLFDLLRIPAIPL